MTEPRTTEIKQEAMDAIIGSIRSLGSAFFLEFEGIIRYGPLKGYKMLPESSWSKTDLASKLFGCYEREVIEAIARHKNDFDTAIVIGAADGYYGVGLVACGIVERSICFEISSAGQEIMAKAARLNGVADRVSIQGAAGPTFLDLIDISTQALGRTLVIIDIEGGEFEILSTDLAQALSRSHVIIELHGGMVSNGLEQEQKLLENLRNYFDCDILTTGGRDLASMPELSRLNDNLRWLVCSEGRPYRMSWVHCVPRIDKFRAFTSDQLSPPVLPIHAKADRRLISPLLYLCAFGEVYFKEAIISVWSWRDIGGYTGQIVIFCDMIRDVDLLLGVQIERLKIDFVVVADPQVLEPRHAAAYRLRIFEHVFEDMNFIYCDTDMLCISPVLLDQVYGACDFSKVNVYGYSGRDQTGITQAGLVTDDPEILSQRAMCSGLMIFTPTVRSQFFEILNRYGNQDNINGCWEQPMFNYVLLKNRMVYINLDHLVVEQRYLDTTKSKAILNHFCGMRSLERFDAMRAGLFASLSAAA